MPPSSPRDNDPSFPFLPLQGRPVDAGSQGRRRGWARAPGAAAGRPAPRHVWADARLRRRARPPQQLPVRAGAEMRNEAPRQRGVEKEAPAKGGGGTRRRRVLHTPAQTTTATGAPPAALPRPQAARGAAVPRLRRPSAAVRPRVHARHAREQGAPAAEGVPAAQVGGGRKRASPLCCHPRAGPPGAPVRRPCAWIAAWLALGWPGLPP